MNVRVSLTMSALTDANVAMFGFWIDDDARVVQVLLEEALEHLLARVGREHALRASAAGSPRFPLAAIVSIASVGVVPVNV